MNKKSSIQGGCWTKRHLLLGYRNVAGKSGQTGSWGTTMLLREWKLLQRLEFWLGGMGEQLLKEKKWWKELPWGGIRGICEWVDTENLVCRALVAYICHWNSADFYTSKGMKMVFLYRYAFQSFFRIECRNGCMMCAGFFLALIYFCMLLLWCSFLSAYIQVAPWRCKS